MVAVALLSAKGSPGVTTAALALSQVWRRVHAERRVLLAECDVAGGDIAAGYLRGTLDGTRGVLGLAAHRSPDPVAAVWEQVLALDEAGTRLLLPGVTDPARAPATGMAWSTLGSALDGLSRQSPPIDVLLDLGRLRTQHEATLLRQRADLVVLVTASSLPAAAAARSAAAELRPAGEPTRRFPPVVVLVVGEGRPYPADEVGEAIGLPVIGTLPHDPSAAAVFSRGAAPGRHFPRSPLMRSARAVAAALVQTVNDAAGEATIALPVTREAAAHG